LDAQKEQKIGRIKGDTTIMATLTTVPLTREISNPNYFATWFEDVLIQNKPVARGRVFRNPRRLNEILSELHIFYQAGTGRLIWELVYTSSPKSQIGQDPRTLSTPNFYTIQHHGNIYETGKKIHALWMQEQVPFWAHKEPVVITTEKNGRSITSGSMKSRYFENLLTRMLLELDILEDAADSAATSDTFAFLSKYLDTKFPG
jgi:hypothetical protein